MNNTRDDEAEIKHHEETIKEYEDIILKSTDEEEIEEYRKLIEMIRVLIERIKTPRPDTDSYFLPEYRKDGYFNSAEFKEIERIVDEEIKIIGLTNSNEINIIKQEILKNKYGLDWVPLEERFMPGTIVNID